jgi:hypothetical protein
VGNFRWGPGSKFLGTNALNLACILVLQIMSSPLSSYSWSEPIDFPSKKRCHVGLASICHFLVLDPHLKPMVQFMALSQ